MIRVMQSSTIFLLLFSLNACSQRPPVSSPATPTFTLFVAGTETALASQLASPTPWFAGSETALASLTPTPWVAGTQTALAAASASPTATALPIFTLPPLLSATPDLSFSPIFHAFKGYPSLILVGGVMQQRGWLSAEDAAAYVSPDMNYDLYSPLATAHVAGRALEFGSTCRHHFLSSSAQMPDAMVGVASHWIVERRGAQDLSIDNPAYVQALSEWFQSQGNSPAEIRITRILQADIEGDGIDEILLNASYFKDASGHMAETGDYSMVLMRKVVGDQVITIPLVHDYYISSAPELMYPNTYSLTEAIDLNQDGILEVVVGVRRWEGLGAVVYRVDGQNVREVMRAIC